MIFVNKDFDNPPEELYKCFKEKESKLLEQKENHNFDSRCYNNAVVEPLRRLYKNKCAYCERDMRTVGKCTISIEHYRPKRLENRAEYAYYWLGYEWSNLLPTCDECNNTKAGQFPIFKSKKERAQLPLNSNNTIDLERCKANHLCLLNEEPLILHPEIDKPEEYFEFDYSGAIIVNKKLTDTIKIKKAETTIEIIGLTKNEKLILRRKKIIDDYFSYFENATEVLAERCVEKQISEDLLITTYFPLFRKLIKNLDNDKIEFILLERYIFENISEFIINKFDVIYQTWIIKALKLFLQKQNL